MDVASSSYFLSFTVIAEYKGFSFIGGHEMRNGNLVTSLLTITKRLHLTVRKLQ